MSYFYNDKVYDYYEITDNTIGSSVIDKDTIEIINNEKIIFDFSSLFVQSRNQNVVNFDNVETIKIHVDWGDGTFDRLSKPLISNKSTIGTYRPNQWKVIEHLFNVQKRFEYQTDNVQFLHKISITAFNSFNDKITINIPYKVVYKTLYDLGSELSLYSSNTTNTNKVSYTLKQKSSESLIVVMSRDWRTIYGEDESEIIQESVSELFSDDFSDEDLMVWDWKSVPTINLTVRANESAGEIYAQFYETGVSVESWEPYIVFPADKGNKVVKSFRLADQEIESSDKKILHSFKTNETNLQPGIYAISVNPIIGINGVKGSSNFKYVQYSTNKRPRNLRKGSMKKIINIDNEPYKKEIVFSYTLEDINQQVKNLTKAELLLTAQYKDDEIKDVLIDDIKFSYNLLDSLIDKDGTPLYIVNGTDKDFTYTIKMRNIPNYAEYINEDNEVLSKEIEYKVKIVSNDVLGGDDKEWIPNEINNPISFSYEIGEFGEMILEENDQLEKKIGCSWSFNTNDNWDEFKIKWIHIDEDNDETIVKIDSHKFLGNNKFDGLATEVEGDVITKFTKQFDGNTIPDGKFRIENEYIVNMNDYYEKRTKTKSIEGQFNYKRPNITIDDVKPYTVINYDQLRNIQRLNLVAEVCSNYDEEPLKNITISLNGNEIEVSSLNYVHRFNDGLKTVKNFAFKASNANDVYCRYGYVNKKFEITDDLTDLLTLPMGGDDYFTDDMTKVFEIIPYATESNDENEKVDWLWVKQNTLHDVTKSHTFNNGRFFGSLDCNNFVFDDQIRHVIYDIITLSDGIKTYRRFIPYKGDTSENALGSPIELKDADEIIDSESTTKYQKMTDKGAINVQIQNKSEIDLFDDVTKIKNMFLELKKDNKLISRYDVKGLRVLQIEDLDFGQYSYSFIINSEYNKTLNNVTKEFNVSLSVNPNDCVFFLGTPTIGSAKDNKKYISWKWELNHTNAEEVIFVYKATKDGQVIKTEKFNQAKIQFDYQSSALPIGTTVEYYFLVRSSSIDLQSEDLEIFQDESGKKYAVVNKNTIDIPDSSK